MVLAKGTSEVAAKAADRQNPAAGIKAGQRFFFNGIQSKCRQLSVVGSGHPSLFIAAGTAGTGLPLFQSTLMTADIASYFHLFLNPVLKKAGVVDAGGMGLVTLFEGMKSVFDGKGIVKLEEASQSASLVSPAAEAKAEINFNYCTEFIVNKTDSKNYLLLRAYLESIGDSVVVVEDDSIIKVHLYTNQPGNAIQEGLKFGWLTNMKIDNLRQQHDEKSHSASEFKKNKTYKAVDAEVPVGFVSVATGGGIVNLFKELGADAVISGGQTMNPSTQSVLTAIQSVGAKTVVVLPNNKNIIMASEQAAKLADREVVVVQTKSNTFQKVHALARRAGQ